MNELSLVEAVDEAKRFIKTAKKLQERRSKGDLYAFQPCKESGACRRSSLDLTRALAELRKPNS
jgi:hypothetical protein